MQKVSPVKVLIVNLFITKITTENSTEEFHVWKN